MSKNIFSYLNDVYKNRKLNDDEMRGFSPFLINRFISMAQQNIGLCNIMNQYTFTLPKDLWFELSKLVFKKRYNAQYIKKTKDEDKKLLVDTISRVYKMSRQKSKDVVNLLDEIQIEKLATAVGLDNRERKKLGLKPLKFEKVKIKVDKSWW